MACRISGLCRWGIPITCDQCVQITGDRCLDSVICAVRASKNLRRRVDIGDELGDPGVLLAARLTLPSGRIVSLQFLKLFQADLAFKGHDVGSAGKQQN